MEEPILVGLLLDVGRSVGEQDPHLYLAIVDYVSREVQNFSYSSWASLERRENIEACFLIWEGWMAASSYSRSPSSSRICSPLLIGSRFYFYYCSSTITSFGSSGCDLDLRMMGEIIFFCCG